MELEPRPEPVRAPFSEEQVVTLNRYQRLGVMHPFTCGMHSDTSLIATTDGWHCPYREGTAPVDVLCDYTQDWAHAFMADPKAVEEMFQGSAWMREAAATVRRRQRDEPDRTDLIEQACEVMHDAYEKAAVGAGWETNPASRKPWSGVPEANKATMRAAVGALVKWLSEE